jgi:hypothetical protein
MADEILAFDRWVEEMGWAAKWRAQGKVEGKAEGKAEGKKDAWEAAIAFLKQGHTGEELERMPPPATMDS